MANQNHVKLVLSQPRVLDAWRKKHPDIRLDLSDHLFRPEKELNERNLSDAILTHAVLERTDLRQCILARADLSFANLTDADMYKVDLRNANLRHAILLGTNLEDADLRDADLTEAVFGDTRLLNTQLTGATGLLTITHARESQMDADTLSKNRALPEDFLLKCGYAPRLHKESYTDRRKVFVVHGRNRAARDALFTLLRAIGLHPLEWPEVVKATGKASPYIGEVLETAFAIVQAVVVLMTPDDEARLREPYRGRHEPPDEVELTPQPRPNVLVEAGMALGLFPERTVIVELGRLRQVSDLLGRHTIRMDDSPEKRQELAQRLETAGCAINRTGTDWYKAGDFVAALAGCHSLWGGPRSLDQKPLCIC